MAVYVVKKHGLVWIDQQAPVLWMPKSIPVIRVIPSYFAHHLWPEKNISYRELMEIMIKQAIDSVNHGKQQVIDNKILENLKAKDVRELK